MCGAVVKLWILKLDSSAERKTIRQESGSNLHGDSESLQESSGTSGGNQDACFFNVV